MLIFIEGWLNCLRVGLPKAAVTSSAALSRSVVRAVVAKVP
jgi:hypothetical protein